MRYRRGEVNPDRRPHHLPEAEQRGSSTCLLAERGESLGCTERIDDAHAEQEHRHGREERQEGRVKDRYQQEPDTAGCRRQQAALDRAIEPEARRQLRCQHAGGEHDHHRAREEQAELDRREVQSLDENAGSSRKHREQSAHDQADGRGRNEKAAIDDEADIIFCNRKRIERDPRRAMGFAEHRAIGDSPDRREHPDKDEFGTPAENVVERAAEQRREAGRCRHRHHDQRHRAGQRRAAEEIAGNGARQHRGCAGAGGLDDAAGQKARQVSGEAAPDAAGDEHHKTCQHRPAPAVAIRDRPHYELAEREHREENRDGGSDRRRRYFQ